MDHFPPLEHRGLLAADQRRDELRRTSLRWPSWTVSGAPLADLESLLTGWLWPLAGYGVIAHGDPAGSDIAKEIACGLEVSPAFADVAHPGVTVALRDAEGVLLAALTVDQRVAAEHGWRLTGRLEGVDLPPHDDFRLLRLAPAAIADRSRALAPRGLAFFAGEVLHAGIRAALVDASERLDAAIVVIIASGSDGHDGCSHAARIRALQRSAGLLPPGRTVVALAPMPSTVVDHPARAAIMARNCGASGVAVDVTECPPDDLARVEAAAARLALAVRGIRPWNYDPADRRMLPPETDDGRLLNRAPASREILSMLPEVPSWLLSPAEVGAARRAYPPREAQGFAVFLTGLSGAGKSTIARALRAGLMEATGRPVTLLDGDIVRRHLSSELGFSREHRDLNVLRIGWVASEIVRHGGIALCAPIAPYDAVRRQVRRMIEPLGGFLLVHVSTPLETCEARDRKGLYAKARAGPGHELHGNLGSV